MNEETTPWKTCLEGPFLIYLLPHFLAFIRGNHRVFPKIKFIWDRLQVFIVQSHLYTLFKWCHLLYKQQCWKKKHSEKLQSHKIYSKEYLFPLSVWDTFIVYGIADPQCLSAKETYYLYLPLGHCRGFPHSRCLGRSNDEKSCWWKNSEVWKERGTVSSLSRASLTHVHTKPHFTSL